MSQDGKTLAIGASGEDSAATGVDGDQDDNSIAGAGAIYIYRFDSADWYQQAYIKASNSDRADIFGGSVSLSEDGNVLAVGAYGEASNATGIGGDQDDNSLSTAGATYLYRFDGSTWLQESFVKASNSGSVDFILATNSSSRIRGSKSGSGK